MLWLALLSGCGLIGRKTALSTSVNVTQEASIQEIATLRRSDYTVLDSAQGQILAQQFFVLWFPVGTQKTRAELFEDAYFKATQNISDCDALLLPHATTKTVFIPLVAINILTRQVTLHGRCIRIKTDEERASGEVTPQ